MLRDGRKRVRRLACSGRREQACPRVGTIVYGRASYARRMACRTARILSVWVEESGKASKMSGRERAATLKTVAGINAA